MPPSPVNRRLVAVLAADAVGYSRLMSEDEESTLRVLAAHRSVIDGIIEFHGGRIFKTAGDSVLAEFSSSVDAVRCALEIQDALKTRNDSLPENRRLLFRIGVNLGDVVVKEGDLLGDGVNVAARLEGIADPGCICISSAVYDQVVGKLSLGFTDLGKKELKNITRPVHVFGVAPGKGEPSSVTTNHPGAPWRWLAIAATLVAVVAGSFAVLQRNRPVPVASAPASDMRQQEEREKLLWDTVRTSNNISELEAYLKQYPAGMFSDVAKARIENLRHASQVASKAAEEKPVRHPPAKPPRKNGTHKPKVAATPAGQPIVVPPPPAKATPVKPAYRYDGRWNVLLNCGRFGESAGFRQTFPGGLISRHRVSIERGTPGQPGYQKLEGQIQEDGTLLLDGFALSVLPQARGKQVPASFRGKFDQGQYEGKGAYGGRPCTLTLLRR